MKLREILVINDDGIDSKGIKVLSEFMRKYGNVTVVAPKYPQSGKSASLTLDNPLILKKYSSSPATESLGEIHYYSLSGTPADCAKMAINIHLNSGIKTDLLVSGINHGTNCSIASVYSGTLGAAAEATIYGIPALGFSLDDHSEDANFESTLHYADIIIKEYLNTPYKEGVYLNINVPNLPVDDIKGIKFAKQGRGQWIKEFDEYKDPKGHQFFWMGGHFNNLTNDKDADHIALHSGYVTIVPHKVDNTDYEEIERLKSLWNI